MRGAGPAYWRARWITGARRSRTSPSADGRDPLRAAGEQPTVIGTPELLPNTCGIAPGSRRSLFRVLESAYSMVWRLPLLCSSTQVGRKRVPITGCSPLSIVNKSQRSVEPEEGGSPTVESLLANWLCSGDEARDMGWLPIAACDDEVLEEGHCVGWCQRPHDNDALELCLQNNS